MLPAAQGLDGLQNSRVRVPGQKNGLGAAGLHGLAQLLHPGHQPLTGGDGQIAALRDYRIIFVIHTSLYYTLFFRKVNKNLDFFSASGQGRIRKTRMRPEPRRSGRQLILTCSHRVFT